LFVLILFQVNSLLTDGIMAMHNIMFCVPHIDASRILIQWR